MILTCPDCGTQYVVKDGAIPPEGRQVRCAACKHSWHQDPEAAVPEAAADSRSRSSRETEAAQTQAPDRRSRPMKPRLTEDESFAEATLIEPRSGPEAEERAYEEAVIEGDADAPSANEASAVPETAEPRSAATADSSGRRATGTSRPRPKPATDDFSPFAGEDERAAAPQSGVRRFCSSRCS